ncbi:MAG: SCO family protein [Gemmatimonadaceae bacterium]
MSELLHPTLAYVSRLLIAVCVALTACGREQAASAGSLETGSDVTGLRGTALREPLTKPAFVLTRSDGAAYDFVKETNGRLVLLFFGYTHCPDVCPLHMANIAAVLKKLPWEQRNALRVVFVTTDPSRDTPQRLNEWLSAFDPAFVGLRGTIDAVDDIQTSLGIAPATREPATDSGEYLVSHAAQVFAFGRDGVARVAYPFGTRQDDWAHDIPRLLAAPPEQGSATAKALGSSPNLTIAPVVIASAPDGLSGALYVTVGNSGSAPDTLRAVAVISGPSGTLHITTTDGAVATMRPVESLEIPAAGRLEMRPGAAHVMLDGASRLLAPGTGAAVELHFARRGRITALASVVTYAQLDSVLALARAALNTR